MKYIIIGLGYFGSTLASNLTNQGHEVIGIDNNADKVDDMKDDISVVMEMDATNPNALKSLPVNDVDAVIVAIGEDIGSSILALAILKNMPIKRLIGRAITPIHRNILVQLGIQEIVQPEEDSALNVSSMLLIKNALNVMELNNDNAIAEISIPKKYIGHSLSIVDPEVRFNIKIVALKTRYNESLNVFTSKKDYRIEYKIDRTKPLKDTDFLVLAGKMEDIKRFTLS
jgi:trk system potassium uptake protein TrkA